MMMRSRSVRWIASLTTGVLLLPGCDATDNTTADTTLAATATTAAPTTMPAVQDDTTAVPAPIAVAWSYQGTVDDWLTEPVMLDGEYYATRKGLDDDTQQEDDGQVAGMIEDGGELWTSLDGVTWRPADESEQPPPASPEAPTDGAAVVVRRNPIGDLYGLLVAEGLWATSDGTSWREIALRPSQDNWIPWVATGGLGWVVYSPPTERTVEADGSSAFQGQRGGNLGLWYTPDTEAWFEVTDLGPLANAGDYVGEVGVIDTAMIVRDTDILVYVHIAKNIGFGMMGDPHTEVWQLDLTPKESDQVFDFSAQNLCDWLSAEDITLIVASTYKELGVQPVPGQMAQRQGVPGEENLFCEWVADSQIYVLLTTDFERTPVVPFGPHAALDDSVRVSIQGDGNFILTHGLDALLVVDGHDEQLWFGHTTPDSLDGDVEMINTVGLTIANKMLQQMGWIDVPKITSGPPIIADEATPGLVWTGPEYPIALTLDPAVVPAEIDTATVTVTGRSYDDIWLVVCAGARGVVNPEDWPGIDTWNGDMAVVCGEVSREAGTLANPKIEGGAFEATLQVPIDAQAIDDGGVVISAGDIWVVLRGNALLRIGPGDESSPWERFGQDHYNTSRLESVITNWGAFEFVFNAVYQEHEACAQAYAEAQEARSGYLNLLSDHETQDKPGLEYDRLVARLTASERWLQVKGCPGAGDFTRIG